MTIDLAAEYAIKGTVLLWVSWRLFQGPRREPDVVPSRKSIVVRGYEIPNPYPSVLATHAAFVIGPAAAFLLGHRPFAALASFLAAAALFHLRNRVVRAENAALIHDPVWGAHISRQRQQEGKAQVRSWLRAARAKLMGSRGRDR